MSVQPISDSPEAPIWSGWQNAVINGTYPLQRLLHGSQHSAVFLTQRAGQPGADAALKLVPIERVTLAQLSHWKVATGLSHPHLIRLFDAGLCHLAGRQFLFVVMEYAQETLGGVLAQRALTAEEVSGLLPPTLEALVYLHRQGLIVGHLQPANVLVVDDQVKLASDSIRPTGAPRVGGAEPCAYDAPEATRAPFSPGDDIWGLGVTLVEALTQRLPWADEPSQAIRLPETVPADFVDLVQRCLAYEPARRRSAAALLLQFTGAPEAPPPPVAPEALAAEAPRELTPTRAQPGPRGRRGTFVAAVFLALLAAVWADLRIFHRHAVGTAVQAPVAIAARSVPGRPVAAPPSAALPIAAPPRVAAARQPAVLHAQLPDVSRSALRTIHGRVKVSVLAVVDHSGVVIASHLENGGPSAYFASRAAAAARKWRFAPTAERGTRQWLLHFEFTRSGSTAAATPKP